MMLVIDVLMKKAMKRWRKAHPTYHGLVTGYDAFITHDWGVAMDNHERVKEINRLLQARGLGTWFDEERSS